LNQKIFLLEDTIKNLGRGVRFPQHQKMSKGYDYKAENSIHKLRHDKLSDFKPNFDTIIHSKGVSLNDKISSAPFPLGVILISDKFLKLLKKFKLPDHRIYKAPILHGNNKIDNYFAIQIVESNNKIIKFIDFDKSVFWRTNLVSHERLEKLTIKNFNELLKAREEITNINIKNLDPAQTIWADKLCLKEEFYKYYDIFNFALFTFPKVFKITGSLRNAIVEEQLTGMEFIDVTNNRDNIPERRFLNKEQFTIFI